MIKPAVITIVTLLTVCSIAMADSIPTPELDTEWALCAGVGKNFHVSFKGSNVRDDIVFVPLTVSWTRTFHAFSGGSRAAYSVEGFFSYIRQEGKDRYMIGVTPFLVYNFNACRKLIPWVEAGVGIAATNLDPEGFGENFGFTPQLGFGVRYPLSSCRFIRISYRYHHISNAGLKDENRSIDSNIVFVGYSFSF